MAYRRGELTGVPDPCPACGIGVPEGGLRCEDCGELLIGDAWRRFLERYDLASDDEREALRQALPAEDRRLFRRVREAWDACDPEERTTSIVNPIAPAPRRPPASRPATRWAGALLPTVLGVPLVLVVSGSAAGLLVLLALSLAGAAVTARREPSDLRSLTALSSWLVVSLFAALALYFRT